jgi:two-component system NarL family sensor kinase
MQEHNYIGTFFVTGTLSLSILSFFLIYFINIQRTRRNTQYLETQNLIISHQAREARIRIEENERTMAQVSKEVHDNIGQIANLVMMHLNHFETILTTAEQSDFIQRIIVLSTKLIRDANNISHSLSGEYIKLWGLQSMILNDLEHIKASRKIDTKIIIAGDNNFLDEERQLIIYRIAQEAINNILKHSKATHITVKLVFDAEFFSMSVVDNGVGFTPALAYLEKGTGLLNMNERAKFLDAELIINAKPYAGCLINLTVNI